MDDYGTDQQAVKPSADLDANILVKELSDALGISTIALAHLLAEIDGDPHVTLISLFWGEKEE